MKKVLILSFLFIMCSSIAFAAEPKSKDWLADKTLGMVVVVGMDEEQVKQAYFVDEGYVAPKKILFYTDYQTKFMALSSGKVDAVYTINAEADYYTKSNPDLEILDYQTSSSGNFHMIIHKRYFELKDQINSAITTLTSNGVLNKLTDTFVTNAKAGTSLPKVELPNFPGKPTYTMVVLGATAPFDMIDSAGNYAGFNIALMAEISKLLNVNFKFVTYDTVDAAFAAITADKAAGLFLLILWDSETDTWSTPDYLITEPYGSYSDFRFVGKKK